MRNGHLGAESSRHLDGSRPSDADYRVATKHHGRAGARVRIDDVGVEVGQQSADAIRKRKARRAADDEWAGKTEPVELGGQTGDGAVAEDDSRRVRF